MIKTEQNHITLIGIIKSPIIFSHTVNKEDFFKFDIEVRRLSGENDLIPVIVSSKIIKGTLAEGEHVCVTGQIRTHNQVDNSKRKLCIYVFANNISSMTKEEFMMNKNNSNDILIIGFICKKPTYRTTPFGREITDLLVAVNRSYHKSDYIPCIAWGRNARYVERMDVGQQIEIKARFQSRVYQKREEDGQVHQRTAYELSIVDVTAL